MILARGLQADVVKAARGSGLILTTEQVRDIAEAESACLAEHGRVTFGGSAAVRVVRELASSPFVSGNVAEALLKLTEVFYELREGFPPLLPTPRFSSRLRMRSMTKPPGTSVLQ